MTTQTTTSAELARARAKSLADISPLADPPLGNAPITPDRYFSKEWADREWDKIWTKTWQIAGTLAQIPKTLPSVVRSACCDGDVNHVWSSGKRFPDAYIEISCLQWNRR